MGYGESKHNDAWRRKKPTPNTRRDKQNTQNTTLHRFEYLIDDLKDTHKHDHLVPEQGADLYLVTHVYI